MSWKIHVLQFIQNISISLGLNQRVNSFKCCKSLILSVRPEWCSLNDIYIYIYIYIYKMLLTSKIYNKFFILCLISTHATLREFSLFYIWSEVILKCEEEVLFWKNRTNFFGSDFFYFSAFASSLLKYKKTCF